MVLCRRITSEEMEVLEVALCIKREILGRYLLRLSGVLKDTIRVVLDYRVKKLKPIATKAIRGLRKGRSFVI